MMRQVAIALAMVIGCGSDGETWTPGADATPCAFRELPNGEMCPAGAFGADIGGFPAAIAGEWRLVIPGGYNVYTYSADGGITAGIGEEIVALICFREDPGGGWDVRVSGDGACGTSPLGMFSWNVEDREPLHSVEMPVGLAFGRMEIHRCDGERPIVLCQSAFGFDEGTIIDGQGGDALAAFCDGSTANLRPGPATTFTRVAADCPDFPVE